MPTKPAALLCYPRKIGKGEKRRGSFAEYGRGITDRLAGEFRDWTMSLESTDIVALRVCIFAASGHSITLTSAYVAHA